MGFRIDKIWGQYTSQLGTARKVRREPVNPDGGQQNQSAPEQDHRHPPDQKKASFEEVEKAVQEAADVFSMQGIRLLVVQSGVEVAVKFLDADGQLIRQVSGEEFLQLKKSSHLDKTSRGKVLDQKF